METIAPKDNRYTTIFFLLKEKAIKSFEEIFVYLPYTIVARDIKVGNITMKKLVTGELYDEAALERIADWIGCDKEVLLKLSQKQQKKYKKSRL